MTEAPLWFREAIAAPRESRTVEVHGCPIHYLHWGESDRPGLVLVHGSAGHAHWWSFIAPQLAHDYQVAAIDLSGHGDSGRRDECPRDLWVDEVMSVARDAGFPTPPAVIGHSMRGMASIATAVAHGDDLGGIVPVSADGPLGRIALCPEQGGLLGIRRRSGIGHTGDLRSAARRPR